ncbi:hypothetical protein G9A89_011720 [Geosiphon pyriformis]|nr:hypothetical protein G9A89_011720 [Geosiphon pyriformis]
MLKFVKNLFSASLKQKHFKISLKGPLEASNGLIIFSTRDNYIGQNSHVRLKLCAPTRSVHTIQHETHTILDKTESTSENCLVKAFVTSINKPTDTHIAQSYQALSLKGKQSLKRPDFNLALRRLRKTNEPKDLEIAHLMVEDMQKLGMKITLFEYNTLIGINGQQGKASNAWQIYETMMKDGTKPDLETFNFLMDAYKRSRDFEGGFKVWEEMRKIGIKPDLFTFNSLIALQCWNDLDIAAKLYEEMQAIGISPDAYTLMPLLKGFLHSGREKKVESTYNELIKIGARMTDIEWKGLIQLYISHRRYEQASKIHKAILDLNISPGISTYNALIDACFKIGNLSEGLFMLERMSSLGLKPNKETYCNIIHGLAEVHDIDLALGLIARMNKEGIKMTDSDYVNFFLKVCQNSRKEDLPKVYEIFQGMKSKGHEPDPLIYNGLLEAHLVSGDHEGILQVFEKMIYDGISPDSTTYLHLIRSRIQAQRVQDALNFYGQMIERNISMNIDVYDNLFYIFAGCFQMAAAAKIFEDMRRAGVRADGFTYSILITGYSAVGDWFNVRNVHNLLKVDYSLDLDMPLVNSIMSAYNIVGDGNEVLVIWDSLWLTEQPINDITVSVVLDACGYYNFKDRLDEIWQDLKSRKFELSRSNYDSYIEALARHGRFDDAKKILMIEMPRDNIKPGTKSLRALLSFLHHENRKEDEYVVIEWVREKYPELAQEMRHSKLLEENDD